MMANSFYIILASSLTVVVAGGMQCGELQRNTSNDTTVLTARNSTGVCVSISDAKDLDLIHSSCWKYLDNRCSLFTHTNETCYIIDSVLRAINDTLVDQGRDNNTAQWCGDVLLAIVCNSVYLGCDPTTNLPIGLCESTCLEYTTSNTCLPFFAGVTSTLDKTEESAHLDIFTSCTANSHSFFNGDNESITHTCYQELAGISKNVIEVLTTTQEIPLTQSDETREEAGMRNIALAYILPSVCAVFGTGIVIVIVLSGVYLRGLRKRSRCIGLAGDSYSHTNAFPQLLGVREIYSNRYFFPHSVTTEDGNREVERSILPVTAVSSTTGTSSGASNMTENSAVFQLDLADWAAVGEGVLIPFEHVTITGHLGEGAFGYVVKGLLKEVHANGREYHMPVAMKTLKNCASYDEMRGLLVESSLMFSFSHPHILSLRGLCLNPKSGAPYLVMPFMENGDLRKFLRKKADLTDGSSSITTYPHGLTHELLAQMCCDVAKGMEYLAEKRLVHRDLAARNCMVDRKLRVRVADFGLTREIYEQDYYRQSSQGQLPIKWMSPESLAYRMSNEKTDVWSFGVTCWEVFSVGKVPYPTIDNRDLLDYLDCGRRLSKPRLCNQHVYDVMQLCWNMQPEERPTFSEIVTLLQANTTEYPLNQQTHTSCTNQTPHPSLLCSVMKQNVTEPVTREETDLKQERNADEEYVEMSCNESSKDGVLIVANSSATGSSAETLSPEYLNLTKSDIETSGSIKSQDIDTDTPDKQSTVNSNRSASNTASTSNNCETEEVSSTQKESTVATELPKEGNSAGKSEEDGKEESSGLLDSIINYFQEKTTQGSQESLDRDVDTDFLAVQMKEIETHYRSRSVSSPLRTTSSLPHNHTHLSSRSHSTTERALSTTSKFTPLIESTEELSSSSPYTRISIYDECPTTPNVTILFKTGERVTPAEKVFAFSRDNRSQVPEPSARQKDAEIEATKSCWEGTNSEEIRAKVAEKGRVGGGRSSVVSMPGGRGIETGGGGWRERLRERLFSYSAGDYVKMHPAAPNHH